VGTKRKQDPDTDEDKPEDEINEEAKAHLEDRGYLAKKWKPVPEALLEPEHKHFEFLAKRRKGLPSLYGPEQSAGVPVPMRNTKVQRANAEGEVFIYQVLVPEGQVLQGEISEANPEQPEAKVITPGPGSVIEGLGIANDEGVVVAEHLKPTVTAAPRRNRPPPKKKGGPGRGKKRVTFTNPDGSTYTTVVPNATKIVPQPGQTVKHVAKGEEATADVSAEQAAAQRKDDDGEEGEEGEGSDDGDDDGDDDDDDDGREEGELSEDDAPRSTANATPVPSEKKAESEKPSEDGGAVKGEDIKMEDAPQTDEPAADEPADEPPEPRSASSSPELPLAKTSHSRQSSALATPTVATTAEAAATSEPLPTVPAEDADANPEPDTAPANEGGEQPTTFEDGDEDLLGSLEKSLGDDGGDGEEGGS
jgi:hypothetical protein